MNLTTAGLANFVPKRDSDFRDRSEMLGLSRLRLLTWKTVFLLPIPKEASARPEGGISP
jgi:hypothetical protein